MYQSLYRYRSFIWQHALSDLRHRYAGTAMGVVWNVIHPLALMTVYALVFSVLYGSKVGSPYDPGQTVTYAVFLCAGFFPWMSFSECLTRGSTAFVANATYLKKLPVPEQVFVVQEVVAATLSLGISFSLLLVVSLLLGVKPSGYWLLLPIPLILLQAIGCGFGLICGTLNVFFSDVSQLIGIILQLFFWMTPIIYQRRGPGLMEGHGWLQKAVAFNPATPAIESIRDLFLWQRLPAPWTIWALLAWGVGTLTLGYLMLHALRAEIRDVI